MKKGSILFLIVVLLSNLTISAQVNLQTGAAEYSLPLYSYTDPANRIGTGITLHYMSGNGLKVNDIPSSVGAGWELQCGGFIQRIQHGEPDDQKRYTEMAYTDLGTLGAYPSGNYVNNYYPNGYIYSEYDPTVWINNGGGYTPVFEYFQRKYLPKPEYMADLEQDIFAFNFNGRTGQFVISKPQNGVSEIKTLYDSKLKIQKIDGDLNNTNNIRTTISEFQITDENGIKYIFKDAELSQLCTYDQNEAYDPDGLPYSGPSYQMYYQGTYPSSNPNLRVVRSTTKNAFVKNKWYLSEIVNPLTGVKIIFEYEDYQIDIEGLRTGQYNNADSRTEFSVVRSRIIGTCKRLKKIKSSLSEIVEFNYYSSARIDIPADKSLINIDIRYGGQSKMKWEFEMGYFVKNLIRPLNYSFTTEDKAWSRLCLQSLKRTGTDGISEPPYVFSYYLTSGGFYTSYVPPLFSFYTDAWGYFNPAMFTQFGDQLYHAYGGNELPKYVYVNRTDGGLKLRPTIESKNGILKSVRNTLGGTLEYEYELNYFYGVSDIYYGTGGVRVNKTNFNDDINGSTQIKEYKYLKEDGVTTSGWGGSDGQISQISSLLKVYKKCGDQKYVGMVNKEVSSTLRQNVRLDPEIGLSFKEGTINQLLWGIIASIIADLLSPNSAEYTATERNSNMYASHNIIPFQYSRVEVINKMLSGTAGKTVYEFTSPDEANTLFDIDFPTLSTPFSSKQRYASWLYGLPKKITIYDKDNNIIRKVENEYTPYKYFHTTASQKWVANKRTFDCYTLPSNGTGTTEIDHDVYYPICGRVELTRTKLYECNSNGECNPVITDYSYSSNNYLVNKIAATNSKGELIETETKYPGDYTIAGVMQIMQQNYNYINFPVATQTFITKGLDKYLLSGNVSNFSAVPGGDIKTIGTYSAKMVEPVLSTSVAFNSNQLIPNTTYYEENGTITYNANGNPVQTTSDKGKVSNIYDYDNKLSIATIINASNTDVAYTSFEADGKGGWDFNFQDVSEEFSPTGKKCFKSVFGNTGATISRSIDNTKKYTLSFWRKGDNPVMTGATYTLKKTYANTGTGYTYYEYEVTSGTSVNIAGRTGTSLFDYVYYVFNLDEIRLYPTEARMSTATYDPLFGKTSECDENGRITYTEYDNLGKLKLVRDQHRNVIKAYEYNYKQ